MINLMPTDLKESYQYAHHNTKLLGWLTALGIGFLGLIVLIIGGVFYLNQSTVSTNQQNTAIEDSLKQQNITKVETNVQNISNGLKLVVQVLSQEVLFSKLLQQLATITPTNVNLTSLDINNTNGGLDITAITTDYNAATQLQVNLADPANKLFSKADIESISCKSANSTSTTTSTSALSARYPCTVTVRALFSSNNPYLFINNSNATKAGL